MLVGWISSIRRSSLGRKDYAGTGDRRRSRLEGVIGLQILACAPQRRVDGDQHLCGGELIEAAAVALEMALAAEVLARLARQRMLQHPDITAVLDGAVRRPRQLEAADRPWADQVRAGGAVARNGRAAARSRKMRHRRIGPDKDGGTADQARELRPIELAVEALDDCIERAPQPIEIGPLGRIRSAGRQYGEPARGKRLRERAPAVIGPAPETVHRVGVKDRIAAFGPRDRRLAGGRDELRPGRHAESPGWPEQSN